MMTVENGHKGGRSRPKAVKQIQRGDAHQMSERAPFVRCSRRFPAIGSEFAVQPPPPFVRLACLPYSIDIWFGRTKVLFVQWDADDKLQVISFSPGA